MSKAFDTVDHDKLLEKILNTDLPNSLKRWLSSYLHGRQGFTEYINTCSPTRNIHYGVPQGSAISPILFNLYLSDMPVPVEPVHITSYADDVTFIASHKTPLMATTALTLHLAEFERWTQQNNLFLNTTKSTATLFSPDTADYGRKHGPHVKMKPLPYETHPKILGVTFDPKLTFLEHVNNIGKRLSQRLNILRALSGSTWGQSKETLLLTYQATMKSIMVYCSPVWFPLLSATNINKIQVLKNKALRIVTGGVSITPATHLQSETHTLPIYAELTMLATQHLVQAYNPDHPNHNLLELPPPPRKMKTSVHYFQPVRDLLTSSQNLNITNPPVTIADKLKNVHTATVTQYLLSVAPNPLLNGMPPKVSPAEQFLTRRERTRLSQLRANLSPALNTYQHRLNPGSSPACPHCDHPAHDSTHLFKCPAHPTKLKPIDLWTRPKKVVEFLDKEWKEWKSTGPARRYTR
jgi:hypothetical protein